MPRRPAKSDADADTFRCRYCNKAIERGQRSVACGGGPMHAECVVENWRVVSGNIERAIAEGRHSAEPREGREQCQAS